MCFYNVYSNVFPVQNPVRYCYGDSSVISVITKRFKLFLNVKIVSESCTGTTVGVSKKDHRSSRKLSEAILTLRKGLNLFVNIFPVNFQKHFF